MQAGNLRERVGFYRPTIGFDDGAGNTEGGFADVPDFVVAASVSPKLGGETVLANRLTGREAVNITVRRSSQTLQVTTDWRARDERTDTVYNIRSIIDPTQKRQWLEMLCEQGVA